MVFKLYLSRSLNSFSKQITTNGFNEKISVLCNDLWKESKMGQYKTLIITDLNLCSFYQTEAGLFHQLLFLTDTHKSSSLTAIWGYIMSYLHVCGFMWLPLFLMEHLYFFTQCIILCGGFHQEAAFDQFQLIWYLPSVGNRCYSMKFKLSQELISQNFAL